MEWGPYVSVKPYTCATSAPISSAARITAGDGGAPAVTIFRPFSNRTPCVEQYWVRLLTTTGAPHRWVTHSFRISSTICSGSTSRWHTLRAPAAVTAQEKHHPLQWNSGTTQR